jgi:predicted signal transduction protein with EAL and GGDEF domain
MDTMSSTSAVEDRPNARGSRRSRIIAAAPAAWIIVGFLVSSVIFAVDSQIPAEVAISPLYLFPVAVVAWRGGWRWGLVMAVVATAQWFGAEMIAGVAYTSDFTYVWNPLMRFGTFAVVAALVANTRRSHDRYRSLSRTDPATGILNSRTFHEGPASEVERARRHARPVTLIYIDLDHFKQVNDRFGHSTGDAALASVARELTALTRTNDLVARVGGDEFAVLLNEVDAISCLTRSPDYGMDCSMP